MANSCSAFLAGNAKKIDNIKYAVSDRFVGENGDAIEWEIRAIDADENERLRNSCMRTYPVAGGRKGQTMRDVDESAYMAKLVACCTVYPNLNDAEMQDSYHVKSADKLVLKMLTPGEYANYCLKVVEHCDFDTAGELVEEAKN